MSTIRDVGGSSDTAVAEELRSEAVNVLRTMLANDRIGTRDYEQAVERLLRSDTESQLQAVLVSLPSPVTLTPRERWLERPLKIRGGIGRLRLDRRWQLARQTAIRAELGSVTVDLTEAEFDDRNIDLSVYTGWGAITIIVPSGVGVQVLRSHGTVSSGLGPPIPGFPLVRLSAQTNIGRIRLCTPDDVRPRRRFRFARRTTGRLRR